MCAVRFRIAQGVYDKYIYPTQRIEFCRFHAAHIGNIGKGTYPVPHDGQVAMVHSNGDYFYIAYGKGLAGSDVVQFQIGCTGIFLFGKAVGHEIAYLLLRAWLGIYWYVTIATIGAQVVEPCHVVVVVMGDKYGVYATKRLREHLLSEVGGTVDEYACVVTFYNGRRA